MHVRTVNFLEAIPVPATSLDCAARRVPPRAGTFIRTRWLPEQGHSLTRSRRNAIEPTVPSTSAVLPPTAESSSDRVNSPIPALRFVFPVK